jgi:hypothetical protein
MKYRLTIGNYKAIIKHITFGFLFIVLALILTYFIFTYILNERRTFDFVFLISMPSLITILFVSNIRNYSKEEIFLNNGIIKSRRFGQINLIEIKKFNLKNQRGNYSLIITNKSGKKFIFSSRNNVSSKAKQEFNKFLYEFKKQMSNCS